MEIEPPLWEVDANLRPEGKQGALVRSLDSHLAYYDRWAKSWEFQALLKARPLAGDRMLGNGICRRGPAEDLDERRAGELRRQRAAHA
jgi:glutamine synthetase adenylyltransferase